MWGGGEQSLEGFMSFLLLVGGTREGLGNGKQTGGEG